MREQIEPLAYMLNEDASFGQLSRLAVVYIGLLSIVVSVVVLGVGVGVGGGGGGVVAVAVVVVVVVVVFVVVVYCCCGCWREMLCPS